MRVLIDTNIFISYLLSPPGMTSTVSRLVEAALIGQFTLLLPEELLVELGEKLRTSRKLSHRVSVAESQELIDLLWQAAFVLPTITESIPAVVRDSRDNYLLAQALLGNAAVLISRDKDLLSLGQVEDVQILSPFQFVQLYFDDEPRCG